MKLSGQFGRWLKSGLGIIIAVVGFSSVGCQYTMNGQTLPSGYYLDNQVHYAPKGPEFRLAREAAHMDQIQKERQQQQSMP